MQRIDRVKRGLRRPLGRLGLTICILSLATAPAVLFFDPATYQPMRRGHIVREPLSLYKLFSDDVAYVASSRTWDRTVSNLFVPHNTHIVPSWRLVTWGLVASAGWWSEFIDRDPGKWLVTWGLAASAGSLEQIPTALALASY